MLTRRLNPRSACFFLPAKPPKISFPKSKNVKEVEEFLTQNGIKHTVRIKNDAPEIVIAAESEYRFNRVIEPIAEKVGVMATGVEPSL